MDVQSRSAFAALVRLLVDAANLLCKHSSIYVLVAAGATILVSARWVEHGGEKTVEAERFVLRDKNGTKRAELVAENDKVVQTFLDKEGGPRLQLGVDEENTVAIQILSKGHKVRFDVSLDPDGTVRLLQYGEASDGKPSTALSVERGGSPRQSFIDNAGAERIGLGISPDNSVDLTVYDKDKKVIFRQGK